MRPRDFLASAGATAVALMAFSATIAIVVDPYRFFGTAPIPGWTAVKPRVYQEVEIGKTVQLDRTAPRTLLLGNSRVEIGLDPESRYWPADAGPVFNAAVAGRGVFTSVLMLREAIAVSKLKLVVVGLDFQDFLEGPTPPSEVPPRTSEEDRLHVDRNGNPNPLRKFQLWRDVIATTFTFDAFYDSLATLADQNPLASVTMTPLGFNPLNEYKLFVARSSYGALFAEKNAAYYRSYGAAPKSDYTAPEKIASFRYLKQILAISAEHHIGLVLYIHPYHSDYLEMLRRLGLWNSFEDWERALVRVVYADPPTTARLFDFADYNEVTTEPVPTPADSHAQMRWYWESGHYKSALGDKVLAAMLDGERFGHILTPNNVETVIADVRTHRDRFARELTAGEGVYSAFTSPTR